MLPINSMAYGQSGFKFRKQALLKAICHLDFNYVTEINGFDVSVTQPDDCNIRVVFVIDDRLYKFGNDGNLVEYNNRGEIADILINGNTVGELLKVNNIPEFLNKRVYIFIAMDAPIDAPILPKIKLSVKVNSYNDVYNCTNYSPIYKLGNAKIIGIDVDKNLRGNAQANVNVRLMNNLNEWGDWIEVDAANFKLARAVQFRIKYLVTTMDGTDSAKINGITVKYSPDSNKQVGYITEIFTKSVKFESELGEVAARIYHDELEDCQLQAYVNFSEATLQRQNVILGVSNGTVQTFNLAYNGILDRNINPATLSVRAGEVGFYDYHFDTANSTITMQLPKDRTVTASYECGLNDEYWIEIPARETVIENDRFVTHFAEKFDESKQVGSMKFRLTKKNHVGNTPEIYGYEIGFAAQV